MKIISISIYSRDYELIFHKTIEQSHNEKKMEVISAFLNSVNKFGKETFSEDLTRVDMNGIWLDFLHIEKYVIVMVIEVEVGITEQENIVYDSVIHQIEEFIHGMLLDQGFSFDTKDDLEFFSDFIEMKLNALQLGKIMIPSNIESVSDEWNIEMAMVCEISGIPVHHKKYIESKALDPYLISMMLTTLLSFARIELNFKLKRIHLGNRKICVNINQEKLFVLIINAEANMPKSLSNKVSSMVARILLSMGKSIDLHYKNINDTSNIYNVLNEYINI